MEFNDEGWNEETQSTVDELLAMRSVFFGSEEGKSVFRWLMHNLRVMKPVRNETDVALQTFGHKLLGIMGLSELDSHDKLFDYYSEIAANDAVNPKKLAMIRRNINVGRD